MFAIVNYSNITTASSYYSFLITKKQVSEELWGGWESIVPSGIDSGEVAAVLALVQQMQREKSTLLFQYRYFGSLVCFKCVPKLS